MARITWDGTGERFYEMGDKYGVLYLLDSSTGEYGNGVAWNGLTAVTESPEGAEATDLWADDIKYASLRSTETFGFTIEAYTYPEEFEQCDGSARPATGVILGQQSRDKFGFCYRTTVSNDLNIDAYKLHLIYGATASPSERSYATINDSPDAITFSWECDTDPINVEGYEDQYKAVSCITISSLDADADKLSELEDILYGSDDDDPKLPLPHEVIALFADDSDSD